MLTTPDATAFVLDPAMEREIKSVPHFRASHYRTWNLRHLLDSYTLGYVRPLRAWHTPTASTTIADIGTGYGWLAFALALETPARIIALDIDARRVEAARAIASILGVEDRIDWRVGPLGQLPVADRETDIACCLEVIEHVDTDKRTIHDLSRTTTDLLLISTPNGALPIVFHDTALPFCHLMPLRMRDLYAKACRRADRQHNNQFWTPGKLASALPDFDRVSRFFHHESFRSWQGYMDYMNTHPIGHYDRPETLRALWYKLAASLGRHAHYILPNLASVWRRSG